MRQPRGAHSRAPSRSKIMNMELMVYLYLYMYFVMYINLIYQLQVFTSRICNKNVSLHKLQLKRVTASEAELQRAVELHVQKEQVTDL